MRALVLGILRDQLDKSRANESSEDKSHQRLQECCNHSNLTLVVVAELYLSCPSSQLVLLPSVRSRAISSSKSLRTSSGTVGSRFCGSPCRLVGTHGLAWDSNSRSAYPLPLRRPLLPPSSAPSPFMAALHLLHRLWWLWNMIVSDEQ
jgi:hypothetical protein